MLTLVVEEEVVVQGQHQRQVLKAKQVEKELSY
jgi:hypothetical protein